MVIQLLSLTLVPWDLVGYVAAQVAAAQVADQVAAAQVAAEVAAAQVAAAQVAAAQVAAQVAAAQIYAGAIQSIVVLQFNFCLQQVSVRLFLLLSLSRSSFLDLAQLML